MRTYHEPGRQVPVVEEADVFVAGGGPAGVVAAIAAARLGARTCLVDAAGCLGGMWTAGALGWIIDAANKPGIMREIILELDRRGARYRPPAIKTIDIAAGAAGARDFAYDPEELKLVLEEMCSRAGVCLQLHTRVVGAAVDAQQRVKLALTESKSGREAWAAKVFIDGTGDGDLAARAGCGFDLGREGSGQMQPMSLEALATGLNLEEVARYVHNGPHRELNNRQLLLEEMQRAGVSSSYGKPTLWHLRENLYELAFNHEYGVSPLDARQLTTATVHARAEMHSLVNALRSLGGIWAGLQIVTTAEQIGVREGRRIHGLYTVTAGRHATRGDPRRRHRPRNDRDRRALHRPQQDQRNRGQQHHAHPALRHPVARPDRPRRTGIAAGRAVHQRRLSWRTRAIASPATPWPRARGRGRWPPWPR